MNIKNLYKTGLMLLLLVAVFILLPSGKFTAKAETVANHEIFSNKTVESRVKEIQDYYYNKSKLLTVKTAIFNDWTLKGKNKDVKFNYYLKDKELMFAYGKGQGIEYRLYFYKNQLIRMTVDKKGKERKTYTQLYRKLKHLEESNEIHLCISLENFFRIKLADEFPRKNRIKSEEEVYITNISKGKITYHTGIVYGPGAMYLSLDAASYTAKLDSKVEVLDYSESPTEPETRSLKWFINDFAKTKSGFVLCSIIAENGKIIRIELPYLA